MGAESGGEQPVRYCPIDLARLSTMATSAGMAAVAGWESFVPTECPPECPGIVNVPCYRLNVLLGLKLTRGVCGRTVLTVPDEWTEQFGQE